LGAVPRRIWPKLNTYELKIVLIETNPDTD